MADLFTLENLFNLMVLLFLQAVLGFDNLLYISIESQRAPAAQQSSVRRNGILIAIGLRVVLLFLMIHLIEALSDPFVILAWEGVITGGVNFSTIVFLFGGAFIMYTAVKEIKHLLELEDPTKSHDKSPKSATAVIAMIVMMNLVFSFDSILSALAITKVFPVLALAIISSGLAMLLLADTVSDFIKRNRKYEVLGLFILLIVGVVLIGEAGVAAAHAAHDDSLAIHLFGYEVVPMSKTTFYFSVAVLVVVDIIQSGYQRKLDAIRAQEAVELGASTGARPPEPGQSG